MKSIFSLPLLPLSISALALGTPLRSQAQEAVPYLVGTGTQLELVGFPVHSPALDAGTVSSVAGTLVTWSPSFTDRSFGSGLRAGQEYYAEVVGPAGHSWLGHRLELDEAATRVRTDHGLVIAASPYNTRGMPNAALAGARLEVRSHLTVDGLWGETVRNRIVYGGEPAAGFRFSLPAPGTPSATRAVTASLPRSTHALEWIDSFAPGIRITQPLLIPSGTAVAVTFGQRRGSSLGLTAESRSWPTAAPLQAGANLLAYPYPKDMRLGVDWGTPREGFRGLSKPSPSQDRIEIQQGTRRSTYFPELQKSGSLRWRLADPVFTSARWSTNPTYLDQIPVGQGFNLRKMRADPAHFFYPPKL
jgi:hypothetical protein